MHTSRSLITGITTKNGVPLSADVRVYSRTTGILLSAVKSDSKGKYRAFGNPDNNYVIAIDPLKEYNLATQDNVK
ncbi:hypothetical protein [Acinetobacter sp. YH12145]|uniref:hypothetical protein n=1 Tax=Acinetobacter sp. YH12145 TaxID=2601129 RepID=UPI0015D3D132|nr:hypothetical protein [Acinetobacter sp. YH12145]